jgi:endonuclease/exonuclease/phosphatase family metal-dependent hydrolase
MITLFCSLGAAVTQALSAMEQTECSFAQKRYPFLSQDTAECNDDYLLFESSHRSPAKDDIKIGSFNVIRLGTDQAQFKRYDMTADIINAWDLVAVVEIMPTPAAYQLHNRQMDVVSEQLRTHQRNYPATSLQKYQDVLVESYKMPGYLRLLKALRELDPSWSLILGPRATGDTSTSLEITGFYYRAGTVENITSDFCENKRGCNLPIPDEWLPVVSRIPFSATFKAGALHFHGVAVHLRFRENAPECLPGQQPKERTVDAVNGAVSINCGVFTPQSREWLTKFADVRNPKKRGRFIELGIFSEVLKKSKEEVMVMGDFNLEYSTAKNIGNNELIWKRAIDDSNKEVFVHEKTSISRKNGLNSEYDHFIFDKRKFSLCDSTSAASHSFLMDLQNPVSKEPVLRALTNTLQVRRAHPDHLYQSFSQQMDERKKLVSCSTQDCVMGPFFSPLDLSLVVETYNKRIVNTPPNIPYKVFEDLISDHIPISMNCKTH